MLKAPLNKPKLFYLLMGIFVSVIIFYINHFSSLLGENNKLPITLSVWLPLIIVSILTSIGMVTINEKQNKIYNIFIYIFFSNFIQISAEQFKYL